MPCLFDDFLSGRHRMISFKAFIKPISSSRSASSRTRVSKFLKASLILSSLRWPYRRPGVAIRMSQPSRMSLSSLSLFVPSIAKLTLYLGSLLRRAVASFAICIASSRVGEITSNETPKFPCRFLLMRVCIAGRRKAIVLPIPVFAWAKQSILFSNRLWRAATCTGII